MRLGISSYSYTWSIGVPGSIPENPITAVDLLSQAVRLGVGVVQIADNLPLDRLTRSELRDLKARADAQGISIEVGTRGIDRVNLQHYLKLASFLGSPILRIVVDTPNHHPTPDEVVDTLQYLENAFKAARIRLAIENHDRFPCATLVKMIDSLGKDWTGICLDTVNSLGALEGPDVVIKLLGPLAINLHLKDFTIFRASHLMGYAVEGRPAGKGDLDIPGLLKKLSLFGQHPNAILELWTPPESSIHETIAKEHLWVNESISYLREFIPG